MAPAPACGARPRAGRVPIALAASSSQTRLASSSSCLPPLHRCLLDHRWNCSRTVRYTHPSIEQICSSSITPWIGMVCIITLGNLLFCSHSSCLPAASMATLPSFLQRFTARSVLSLHHLMPGCFFITDKAVREVVVPSGLLHPS